MNMLKNFVMKLWVKADGKKTVAGVLLWTLALILGHFNLINFDQQQQLIELAWGLGMVGVAHKALKYIKN